MENLSKFSLLKTILLIGLSRSTLRTWETTPSANMVTTTMKKELGEDVVNKDMSATIAWIQKWREKGEFGNMFDPQGEIASGFETAKQEAAKERARSERSKNVPNKKPEPLPKEKPFNLTNEEWKFMQEEFDRMSEEHADVSTFEEASEAARLEKENRLRGLELFLKWADNLKNQQAEWEKKNAVPPHCPRQRSHGQGYG